MSAGLRIASRAVSAAGRLGSAIAVAAASLRAVPFMLMHAAVAHTLAAISAAEVTFHIMAPGFPVFGAAQLRAEAKLAQALRRRFGRHRAPFALQRLNGWPAARSA